MVVNGILFGLMTPDARTHVLELSFESYLPSGGAHNQELYILNLCTIWFVYF